MMPPFSDAPRRWLFTVIVMITLSLAVIGLAVWNVSLVQSTNEIKEKNIKADAKITAIAIARAAEKRAAKQAANTSRVTGCINAARTGPDLLKVLNLMAVLARNQVDGSRKAVASEPGSPLNPQRLKALQRSLEALDSLRRFGLSTKKQIRTMEECTALAKKLGVNIKTLRQETNAP